MIAISEAWRTRALLALWSAVLAGGCFALFTRHNDFPYFYHPDEPGKVEQVLSGKWNFNHPMALLSVTRAVVEVSGVPRERQAVVEAGRAVAAGFAAGAVVALSLLAWLWKGWAPAVVTGAVLATHHQLYELSHYMKEDTALLFGVACAFLALYAYWIAPSPGRAAALGAACALAVSGKYMGVFTVALAIPALGLAPGGSWRRYSAAWALAFGAALLAINLPLLLDWETFSQSLNREIGLVMRGQAEVTRRVPHAQYWNVFIDNTSPAIWVFLVIFLAARWHDRWRLDLLQEVIICFPFVYAVALSFSPKDNDRYFLPATALFTLLACLGVRDLARWSQARMHPRIALAGAGAVLVLFQLTSLWRYEKAFQRDDNLELIEWLRTSVPANAIIVKDNRIALPRPDRKRDESRMGVIPQTVWAKKGMKYAADLGTLDELRVWGVTYVAVSQSDYGRFSSDSLRPKKGEEETFAKQKRFYEQLFREGDRVFERDRGTVLYLHPGIYVYRIVKG